MPEKFTSVNQFAGEILTFVKKRDNMATDTDVHLLSCFQVRAIEDALMRGQRVEIVRTKDGVKIYTVKRKEINIKPEA